MGHEDPLRRALKAIAACSKSVLSARDEAELLQLICRIPVEVCGYRMAWIGYLEGDDAQSLRPVARAGVGIEDGDLSLPALSSASFPFIVGGRRLGALNVDAAAKDAFDDNEVALLAELANGLACGISAQRTAQAHRRENESRQRFTRILNSVPFTVGLIAPDGTLLDMNEPAVKVGGHPRTELIGKPFADLPWWTHPQSTRAELVAALERAARGETTRLDLRGHIGGNRLVTADCTFTPVRDAEGRVVEIVASAMDVTERELARQDSKVNEERFRQLAESIREVFWMRDLKEGKILYISPAYEAIWGRSCQSLYDSPRDWMEAIHPDDRHWVAQAAARDSESGGYDHEYRITRPDGTLAWVRDRAFPVRDAAGEMVRMVGVADDVTERHQLEEQILQAQKMESIGRLAAGIAHDFNNLLTIILGNSELITSLLPPGHAAMPFVAEVLQTSHRAATLTRQLLAFSRQQFLDPRVLDLSTIVEETEPMLARLLGEDVELKKTMGATGGLVRADPGHLVQVIMNLAINARDAMPAGGRLTIETSAIQMDEVNRKLHPALSPGGYMVLSMSDTGAGMTTQVRSHLFEPFFTTKPVGKGTGLGMSVVYGIVRQSGGQIEVESEPGLGTTFRIYLPTVTDPLSAPLERERPAEARTGGETILLVEDDQHVRRVAAHTLRRAGYTIIEADGACDAIATMTRTSSTIDLVLSDVVMPGMSGRQLAERIRVDFPRIGVLLTSGYTDDTAVQEDVRTLNVAFLQKPYTTNELVQKIRHVLQDRTDDRTDARTSDHHTS